MKPTTQCLITVAVACFLLSALAHVGPDSLWWSVGCAVIVVAVVTSGRAAGNREQRAGRFWAFAHGFHTVDRREDKRCPFCQAGHDLPHRKDWRA